MSDNLASEIYGRYQNMVNNERCNRSKVIAINKAADRLSREIESVLQVIHQSEEETPSAIQKAKELFEITRKSYQKLKNDVPVCSFYKTYDNGRTTMQRYCYLIALTVWLETNTIVSYPTCAMTLGLDVTEPEGFYLSVEDYLIGILLLCPELVRLAVNLVARQEFKRTIQIWKLIMDLNSGFGSINVSTNFLRKRYEFLQYDVRKIDGVVYDLCLRGLIPSLAENETAEHAQKNAV